MPSPASLTRYDVSSAYETVLGRPPESEAVIQETLSRFDSPFGLVNALLGSPEYQHRIDAYRGYGDGDLALLHKYASHSESKIGFVTDFMGAITDITFNAHLARLSGAVESLPIPGNFHAETIEWIGTLRAVDAAPGDVRVAEIGAGWGPWLVTALVGARRRDKAARLVGVEADPGHFSAMRQHLRNNGADEACCTLFQAAIAPEEGWAFFPRIKSEEDWGAAAVFKADEEPPQVDYRGRPLEFDRVRAISMATALASEDRFDLVHIDVQGAEQELLPAAADVLRSKAIRLVIGTHSRAIEGELINLLHRDWILENEKPCRFEPSPDALGPGQTSVDGAQVWRNRNL